MRLVPVNETSTSTVHYGDVVAVTDRWGRWLSARDDGDISMVDARGDWERWIVESLDDTDSDQSEWRINGLFTPL